MSSPRCSPSCKWLLEPRTLYREARASTLPICDRAPGAFCRCPLSHNLLDSKINTVLSMCQDTNLLNPVHGIVQSVVYHEESPPQYQPSYLQSNRSHLLPRRRLLD